MGEMDFPTPNLEAPSTDGDNRLLSADEMAELERLLASGDISAVTAWLAKHPGQTAVTAAGRFEEQKHPRYKKGDKRGGKFAPKGASSQEDSEEEKDGQPAPLSEVPDDLAQVEGTKENQRMTAGVDYFEKGETAQRLLGDAEDTQGLYYDPEKWPETGGWDPDRVTEIHDKIVAHFLAGANGISYEEPVSLYMAGGSGVGKGSIQPLLAERGDIPPNSVYINPDDIKELLPEYQEMKAAGDKYGSWAVHEESSAISKRIQAEAQLRDYNYVLDGTGDAGYLADGVTPKFLGKIQSDLDAGRYVKVVMVDAPLDQAQARAYQRAVDTGRWVPPAEIARVHKSVAARHFEWADQVEDWEMWATDDAPDGGRQQPWMVAKRQYGITTLYDAPRYRYFETKGTGNAVEGVTFERSTAEEDERARTETERRRQEESR